MICCSFLYLTKSVDVRRGRKEAFILGTLIHTVGVYRKGGKQLFIGLAVFKL
jgi:hypothetical protein